MIIDELDLYEETVYKYLPNDRDYYLSLLEVDMYEEGDSLKFSTMIDEKEDVKLKSAIENGTVLKLQINDSKPLKVKISSYKKTTSTSIADITLDAIS